MSNVKIPSPGQAAVCMICRKPITKFEPWGFVKIRKENRWFHEACAKGGGKS